MNYRIVLNAITLFGLSAESLMIGVDQVKAVTLNFDTTQISGTGLSPMPNSPGSAVTSTAQLSNQFLADYGVVFSSSNPYIALVNVGTGQVPSGTNGIGGVNSSGQLSYSSTINATFYNFDLGIKAVTNFVSIRSDMDGLGQTNTLLAFDVSGNLIGSTSAVDDDGGPTMSLSLAGIHSIRVTGTSTTAFDDLTFNSVTSAVPEPFTILGAITAAGFGAIFKRRINKVTKNEE